MNAHIKSGHQVIYQDGTPSFVAVPYDDYAELIGDDLAIPHEVVSLNIVKGYSMIKAWRIYLNKDQSEVAKALGMSQPGYQQIEGSNKPRKATLEKVAKALGIEAGLLE